MRIQRRRLNDAKNRKGMPVPTRFELAEDAFLDLAAQRTGLSHAELIRRSVRLAKRQFEVLNGNYQFLLDLRP
jgi:hypothetical protein